MPNTYALQRLLWPGEQASPLWAETLVMPDKLRSLLADVFAFDVSASAELEGSHFYNAFQRFFAHQQNRDICEIDFAPDNDIAQDKNGNSTRIYALVPIAHAEAAIDLITDQLKEIHNIELPITSRMRETMLEADDNVFGWFDVENAAWYFKDYKACARIRALFHMNRQEIPCIDRVMDYQGTFGLPMAQGKSQMQRLSDTWGRALSFNWNGHSLHVEPQKMTSPAP